MRIRQLQRAKGAEIAARRRLSAHPDGTGIAHRESRRLEDLRRQIDATSDPILNELVAELPNYPLPAERVADRAIPRPDCGGVVLPVDLVTDAACSRS